MVLLSQSHLTQMPNRFPTRASLPRVRYVSREVFVPVTNYHLYPTRLGKGEEVGLFRQLTLGTSVVKSWAPLTDPSLTYVGTHKLVDDFVDPLPAKAYTASSTEGITTFGTFPNLSKLQDLNDLLGKFPEAFYSPERRLPCTDLIQHEITLNNTTPVFRPNYPMSHDDLGRLRQAVEEMLANGWIEECTSDYNAPVVMVRKPNGEVRFCNDFRGLNAVTQQDRWSPPRADEILMSLAGKVLFSKIDLKHGFYQIAIKEGHRPFTAFSAPNLGQYQYIRMPFG